MRQWADEMLTGDRNEGESLRERKVGHSREVVVDVFRRRVGPDAGTYFLRVSLRSIMMTHIISRCEIDLNRYHTEREFLHHVMLCGGMVAEADNLNRGANWDCDYVAKQAVEAAKELLHDIAAQE